MRRLRLVPMFIAAVACWLIGWLPMEAMLLCVPLFLLPNCSCCGIACAACDSNGTSSQMQVDISGVTDDKCTGCSAFNGTWVLAYSGNFEFPTRCQYSSGNVSGTFVCTGYSLGICNGTSTMYFVNSANVFFSGTYLTYIGYGILHGPGATGSYDHGSSPPNCTAISGLSVTAPPGDCGAEKACTWGTRTATAL